MRVLGGGGSITVSDRSQTGSVALVRTASIAGLQSWQVVARVNTALTGGAGITVTASAICTTS
jgi:hypothetical protein